MIGESCPADPLTSGTNYSSPLKPSRDRYSSALSKRESIQTATTATTEHSWVKSLDMAPLEVEEGLSASPVIESSSSKMPELSKDGLFDATSRGTAEEHRTTRKALVGMIAKVMASTLDGDDSKSIDQIAKEVVEIRRSFTKKNDSDLLSEDTDRRFSQEAGIDASTHSIDRLPRLPTREDNGASSRRKAPTFGRGVSRAASAMTSSELSRNLGRRTTQPKEQMFGSNSEHDALPQKPARRRSFTDEDLAQIDEFGGDDGSEASDQMENTTLSSLNDVSGVDANQIESYVLSQLPKFVQDQLPNEEWKRIFAAAAAESQRSSPSASNTASTESSDKRFVDRVPELNVEDLVLNCTEHVDETSTFVSAITSPLEKSLTSLDIGSPKPRKMKVSADLPAAMPARSWKDGNKANEGAPQMPSRYNSRGPRRRSMPSFETPKVNSDFERCSSELMLAPKRKKQLSFDTVQIRHYERILEVNPSTSSGPSVGLGWYYEEDEPVSLHLLQLTRRETDPYALVLSREARESMLLDLGYSSKEIAQAVRLSLKAKNQRKQTYNNLRHERVEYLVEKSKRQVGRLLRFGSGKNSNSMRGSRSSIRRPTYVRREKAPSTGSDASGDSTTSSILKS